jgi:hypothetical protein
LCGLPEKSAAVQRSVFSFDMVYLPWKSIEKPASIPPLFTTNYHHYIGKEYACQEKIGYHYYWRTKHCTR